MVETRFKNLCWSKYNFHVPETKVDILNQSLWYNSFVKIDNKVIFWKWYNHSIRQVKDLIDERGNFYNITELNRVYDIKANYLHLLSIISALPKEWKQKLHLDMGVEAAYKRKLSIIEGDSVSKSIYNAMLLPSVRINNCLLTLSEKWGTELNDNSIDVAFLHNSFCKLYAASVSTHIRNFQFKLIHRLIAINVRLHRWGIIESKNCIFCETEDESYSHLFCNCVHVRKFWQDVFKQLKEKSDIQIRFSESEMLLGTPDKIEPIFDLVLIIGKMHINHCKYNNSLPNAVIFFKRLEKIQCVEKYIATKRNCIETHNKKWSLIH